VSGKSKGSASGWVVTLVIVAFAVGFAVLVYSQ
jgi:hypothetical protein